ncbi:MAG: ferredoxin--NADP reductase [Planctomycetota bacterium]
MLEFKSVIERIEDVTDRIRNFEFQVPKDLDWKFIPGQFMSIVAPLPDGTGHKKRAYSIASSPQEGRTLKLTITRVEGGLCSTYMHRLKVGDPVEFHGPYGKFVIKGTLPERLVFVSVGTGVAPFRSMIMDLYARGVAPQSVVLYHGNRHEDQILYDAEFKTLAAKYPSFTYRPCISRPKNPDWMGRKGYVQENVKADALKPAGTHVYICGLQAMIDAVCGELHGASFPPEAVHFEKYD